MSSAGSSPSADWEDVGHNSSSKEPHERFSDTMEQPRRKRPVFC